MKVFLWFDVIVLRKKGSVIFSAYVCYYSFFLMKFL